jgi:hypothetical protein
MGMARPQAPIVYIPRETALARIEVNGRDALAYIQQRYGDMHGSGRFARTALLVAEHHDVRGCGLGGMRLNQHGRISSCHSYAAPPN